MSDITANPAIDTSSANSPANAPEANATASPAPATNETTAEIKADEAKAQSEPEIAHPWIHQLNRGKKAMADRLASGAALPNRVAEFWAEASWPLHTIEADRASSAPSGDFLERLAKQGLTPAMNVIIHRKSNDTVGAIFGNHAYGMSNNYGRIEAIQETREKAIKDGSYTPKDADAEKETKAQKELKYASYGAEVDLEPEKEKLSPKIKEFNYIEHLSKKAYPSPNSMVEPEAWEDAGAQARALCDKFGLRSVSIPLAFNAAEAGAFVDKLDSALTKLAEFMRVEPQLLGLNQWLGLRARAPGAQLPEEALATQDAEALAKKEKDDAKKKKADSEHGLFMGHFIQIEVSPNFEPVVLAHEWFHSLDLWYGSREIVAAQPWRGWSIFASQVAFTEYEQSEKLKEWRRQLTHGGEQKADFLAATPDHTFLSQMRFDTEHNPEGEFHLSASEILANKFMRGFADIAMDEEKRAATAKQAGMLAAMIVEEAKNHAKDHEKSGMSEDSLARRRKGFLDEWGAVASDWGRRQAEGAAEPALADLDAVLKAETLRTLSGAWNYHALAAHYPSPDVHARQAMRMDALGGNLDPYFTTPHEIFAYKLEEVYHAGKDPEPDDKMGSLLVSWLRDEAAPALKTARDVTFQSLMGSRKKRAP